MNVSQVRVHALIGPRVKGKQRRGMCLPGSPDVDAAIKALAKAMYGRSLDPTQTAALETLIKEGQ